MTVLSAHQPMFLPWRGLFDKISQADKFCVFDDVPLERSGFGNRNYIKTANGPLLLTVPIHAKNHFNRPIRELMICNDTKWQKKHLRSIELAYRKAPSFEYMFEVLTVIYSKEWETLAGLNRRMLDVFLVLLDIQVELVTASEQGFVGTKSDLVLDMCLKLGATEYIFGSQGRDYADIAAFEKAGVKVRFQDYEEPPYQQLHGDFIPKLSVIDYLMNSPDLV